VPTLAVPLGAGRSASGPALPSPARPAPAKASQRKQLLLGVAGGLAVAALLLSLVMGGDDAPAGEAPPEGDVPQAEPATAERPAEEGAAPEADAPADAPAAAPAAAPRAP